MSGPIIRKYGFPNFEKIFGERTLEHGVDEKEPREEDAKPRASDATVQDAGSSPEHPNPKRPTKGR